MYKSLLFFIVALLVGCAQLVPEPMARSAGHLSAEDAAPASDAIPEVVEQSPYLPPPSAVEESEKYTVVVSDVPVKELLFALARDAALNIDIHPDVTGNVTLNAVSQTLPQILARLSKQVDLRYETENGTLSITPDMPYYHIYTVDFLNMSRDTTKTVTVATQIDTGGTTDVTAGSSSSSSGSGDNNSTTIIESVSNQHFWERLVSNILAILGEKVEDDDEAGKIPVSNYVIANPEGGVITVLATHAQQERIQILIDRVVGAAQRQVLVEATIVEVTLSDRYQAGIDWTQLADKGRVTLQQSLLGGGLGAGQFFSLNADYQEVDVTVRALNQFGDVQVLSSPKIMVLNNQTALLKVVDNEVYFTINAESNRHADGLRYDTAYGAGGLRHERDAWNLRKRHNHIKCPSDDFSYRKVC